MTVEAFMYFPGSSIKGETQDSQMNSLGAFKLLDYELGAENTISFGSKNSAPGVGKGAFKELTFTKQVDSASAMMFLSVFTGKKIKDCIIEVRSLAGGPNITSSAFFKIELKQVYIQDVTWSGSEGDAVSIEAFVLRYREVEVTYSRHGKNGKMKQVNQAKWNSETNKGAFSS